MARLDLRLAPLRERAAGLREVSDVAVGQRDQLDFVPLRREQRCRSREFQLGIVRMRAERDDSQLPGRGSLRCDRRRHRPARNQTHRSDQNNEQASIERMQHLVECLSYSFSIALAKLSRYGVMWIAGRVAV